MLSVKRPWSAVLSATVVAVAVSATMAAPASAAGGPCGQGGSGSGSLGSSGSSGSATGSLGKALPWLTGSPDGRLPRLTGRTTAIEMVTGPGSPNDTIKRFGVSGTDLGIMWDNGHANGAHEVLMAFGDTVGDCGSPEDDWRSNVLFRSSDTRLADGMRIDSSPVDSPNHSTQVIKGFGIPGEYTVIPTAGVAVGGVQYARFMSVKSWDTPGNWTTNYSATAVSTDNGETWTADPTTIRANIAGVTLPGIAAVSPGNENFQMSAYLPSRDADGFVYEYGTPSGRSGGALLGRVQGAEILNLNAYQYWDGAGWNADLGKAKPVINAPVSELSVQWNDYLGKYVAMYTDRDGLVIRQADHPQGPWSGTQTIISGRLLPSLYGGFMHPWASGQFLESVVTTWDRYNVIYMRTDLSGLKMAATDPVNRPDPATTGEAQMLGVEYPDQN